MGDDWQQVRAWVAESGASVLSLEPLPGDLSQRRYARVRTKDGSLIVARYPAEIRATCARFLLTSALLQEIGVRVPRIVRSNTELGLTLLEDLGPATLHDSAGQPWSKLAPAYRDAAEIIERIQRLQPDRCDALNPRLDASLMRRELDQTRRVFLEPWVSTGDASLDQAAMSAVEALCSELEEDGLVPCHRDFMPRNLVLFAGGLAVLDHQDLRLGPRAYDLASLLNDSLFPPPEFEARVLSLSKPRTAGLRPYYAAVVQRTLKAVGTFALFASRGQARHAPLIQPSLERALRAMSRLPETQEISVSWRPALLKGARKLSATLKNA